MSMYKAEPTNQGRATGLAATWNTLPLIIGFFWLVSAILALQAQTFTVMHAFTGKGDGASPYTAVTLDHLGNLYGTAGSGGAFQRGTVFKISAQGTESILYSFWGGDGMQPSGPPIPDEKGDFYSSTTEGGTPEGGGCIYGCGTVFKLNKSHKESVLYAFTGKADGSAPDGSLVRDRAGNLYGTAFQGGAYGWGVIFKLDKNNHETVLHAFTGSSDGSGASAGLIRDKSGNLYGVAYGGIYQGGVVFKVNTAGQFTVLHSFTGGSDGGPPSGTLLRDAAGSLYGVAGGGNSSACHGGCGVVFRLDPSGKESVLYTFRGSPDGAYPGGSLVRDKSGNFYGITTAGGSGNCPQDGNGCGTVFKLDASGHETVLHNFTGGNDGFYPWAGLTIDDSANLYGTTSQGGDSSCGRGNGCGVVFRLTP
jgi:uncharacterized repeat protein (TIGR03803 family)